MQINLKEKNLAYWLALSRIPHLKPQLLIRLLQQFPNIEEIFTAPRQWIDANLHPETIKYLQNPPWKAVEADFAWLNASKQHSILLIKDDEYPTLLKEIASPPLVLYLKGEAAFLTKPQIAIVGSRHPSPIGLEIVKLFSSELASAGLCITSGLALGIDTAAHLGALSVGQATIAVLGAGLDQIYPRKNATLAEEIAETGLLISEFPMGVAPKPENFPRRNRIISGLCRGTLIVEATLKSGSLITAKYAAEQGREVFAVPSSIFNQRARGCHYLIREGAKLVESSLDILEEFPWLSTFSASIQPSRQDTSQQNKLDEANLKLLECVGFEPTSIEKVVLRSGLTASKATSNLIELELLGYIQYSLGGYSRVHP